MWAAETFNMMQELCDIYGPNAAVYLSQDDKSSVHIGVIAAKRQSAMLMNMRCRVRLPDHDFSVGSRHLLCPSVLAHCHSDPTTGKVGYTGNTYIGIRSSKHNNSTAYTHHQDLLKFKEDNPSIFNTETGEAKPILVKGVDGGPDENPRFDKNIIMGCKTFQVRDSCTFVSCYTNIVMGQRCNEIESWGQMHGTLWCSMWCFTLHLIIKIYWQTLHVMFQRGYLPDHKSSLY